jgi:hypothetical protein
VRDGFLKTSYKELVGNQGLISLKSGQLVTHVHDCKPKKPGVVAELGKRREFRPTWRMYFGQGSAWPLRQSAWPRWPFPQSGLLGRGESRASVGLLFISCPQPMPYLAVEGLEASFGITCLRIICWPTMKAAGKFELNQRTLPRKGIK